MRYQRSSQTDDARRSVACMVVRMGSLPHTIGSAITQGATPDARARSNPGSVDERNPACTRFW
jgi:hypothetical protein